MGLSASESTVRRWSIPDSTLDLHTAGGKRQTRTCSALGHFVGSLAPGSSRGTPDPAGQPLFPVGPGGPAAPGSPHDTLEQADRPAFLVGPGGTEAPGSLRWPRFGGGSIPGVTICSHRLPYSSC